MEKQELISFLHSQEPIVYSNGKNIDVFHLGQLISMFIENEEGVKTYQSFNNILNDVLTKKGCESMLLMIKQGCFNSYYFLLEYKEIFPELLIIQEITGLIELINEQLEKEIIIKKNRIDDFIKKTLNNYLSKDEELLMLINIRDIFDNIISDEYLNLDSMNSKELAEILISEESKKKLTRFVEEKTIVIIEQMI